MFYVSSKHFELELSREKIDEILKKKTKVTNTCSTCGIAIPEDKTICERCEREELKNYTQGSVDKNEDEIKQNEITIRANKYKL